MADLTVHERLGQEIATWPDDLAVKRCSILSNVYGPVRVTP